MTVETEPFVDTRPRLRGHLHFWTFFSALACVATLVVLAGTTVSGLAALATSVYGLTVLGVFGVSALYHRRLWSPRAYQWMKRADHSMIFLFIAGTYTPFTLLAMSKPTGYVVLGVVWGGALAGVALKMLWPGAPRWLGVPIYVALGWVAIFVLPELATHAGVAALVLLLVGGLFYTVGAVFYAVKWPNYWPNTFGYHEFFHACTVLAALSHYIAVWLALYA
ncbi:PAQR family membrane homeostasis protein TrhA [Amycolatopsis methanolica]|uniref:Hemolysin III family channel protein n=1 Tax=Amycolatopsis methanolica 239 TaxID=1068978 RepID=A0A076MZ91_AMYME|nr:hemolysin III family protein [Amycolatopsis methanolica]AIJ25963.1 hemolysin III family channel protein [Amycolatopsis methanolica 239]